MSYATVMVQLELGRSNASPLGVAHDLAKRMHASVIGIAGATPIQTAVMADGYCCGDIAREDTALIEHETKIAEAEFQNEMNGYPDGLDWSMAVSPQLLSDRVAGASGPADILVLGIDQKGGEFFNSSRRVDVDDVIMQAGRPVLVVPLGVTHFNFHCALVAWKESREARRALADALPLLKQMNRVVVAEITDASRQGTAQAGLNRIVAWLGRHGVEATAKLVLAGGRDSDRLMDLADQIGAEVIVAGAYGHSRMREWVLGGVTRDLLHGSRCSLLLSH